MRIGYWFGFIRRKARLALVALFLTFIIWNTIHLYFNYKIFFIDFIIIYIFILLARVLIAKTKLITDFIANVITHAAIFTISSLTILIIFWVIEHWQSEIVLSFVKKIDLYFSTYNIYGIEVSKFVLEFTLTIIFSSVIFIFFRIVHNYKFSTFARNIGLCAFFNNSDEYGIDECNNYIYENTDGGMDINVICATGYNTFCDSKISPLERSVQQSHNVRVLMAYPEGDEIKTRALNVKMTHEEYKEHIYSSLKFLKTVKDSNCHVEVKMYRGFPFWRVIYNDAIALVQQYERKTKINGSPLYAFANEGRTGDFYNKINAIFMRCWSDTRNYTYNLDTKQINKSGTIEILNYQD